MGLVGEKNNVIFKDFKTWSLDKNQESKSILNQTKMKDVLRSKVKIKGLFGYTK